ncbi:MAG: DUF4382 domain-containing protein [Candidatus Micrarchaeia archaeon]
MKKAIALLSLFLLFFGCAGGETKPQPQGTFYLLVTDKKFDFQGVSSVRITVSEAKIFSPQQGWLTVSSLKQTIDLMQLANSNALLAQAVVPPGNYSHARLLIERAVVTANGVEKEAVLPSHELKIALLIQVEQNLSSTLLLDFDLNRSLHSAGDKIVFAPVVKADSRAGAVVSTQTGAVQGGRFVSSDIFGMNERGEVNPGQGIPEDAELEVDETGRVKTTGIPTAPPAQPTASPSDNYTHPAGTLSSCVERCRLSCFPESAFSCESDCRARLDASCDTACTGNVTVFCDTRCESDVSYTQVACLTSCRLNELPKCKANCLGDADANCRLKCQTAANAYAACMTNCTTAC